MHFACYLYVYSLLSHNAAGVGCHFLLQCMEVKSESEVAQSCPTPSDPRTAAHQAPLSMGLSRQQYWTELPFPSPGDLPEPGIEPRSPALQVDSLLSEPRGKPNYTCKT